MNDTINFQELFEGFQNTPLLWNGSDIYGFEQFCPKYTSEQFDQNSEYKKLRLGKWVENFVSFQLQNQDDVAIIEENLIIKKEKRTIGELDILLVRKDQPIHIEVVYKFYLYDKRNLYDNPLACWIGPNRNDALVYKLNKLKEKQFPLLYHSNTIEVLKKHKFDVNTIKQQVCFNAQLYLPYQNKDIDVSPLNKDCVVGWYLNIKQINELENFQFYIPKKLEWLCIPKENVDWLSFVQAKNEIRTNIANGQSPLCWLKNEYNEFQKCFITWW
ncbi:DUF1853 family protein [uncultured Winogradskyella sp.]|uniref:DUF1853 family protein n=1 Tax=uncultured Winogradskyella sp. TaxID=395353 RepID=UPI0026357C1B|nr:DUF1853 family protein [uncultured Winogradskyella sp.]